MSSLKHWDSCDTQRLVLGDVSSIRNQKESFFVNWPGFSMHRMGKPWMPNICKSLPVSHARHSRYCFQVCACEHLLKLFKCNLKQEHVLFFLPIREVIIALVMLAWCMRYVEQPVQFLHRCACRRYQWKAARSILSVGKHQCCVSSSEPGWKFKAKADLKDALIIKALISCFMYVSP